MTMDPTVEQFRDNVLQVVLRDLPNPWEDEGHCGGAVAEELVLSTIVHESEGLEFLHQVQGPALGVANIQDNAWQDMRNRTLRRVNDDESRWQLFWTKLRSYMSNQPAGREQLQGNLYANVGFCRLMYLLAYEPLPSTTDVHVLARYWLDHYNKGVNDRAMKKLSDFVSDYRRYVLGEAE